MKDDFDRSSSFDGRARARFLAAAENGAADVARDILASGALSAQTLERALLLATAEGQAGFVKFLVDEAGLDLSRCGAEALALAVRGREVAVAGVLTRGPGIPLMPAGPMDTHYLDLALTGSNPYSPEVLQLLLDRGAAPIAAGFDSVNTALREENADALKKFVAHDPSLKESLGGKLVSAAMRLDPSSVRMLLEAGVCAGYSNSAALRGVTHQMIDIPNRDPQRIHDCARLLLDAGARDEAAEKEMLKAAIRHRNAPLIHALLSRDVDVEPEMRGIGYNKLVLAATYGFADLVETFHRAGSEAPAAYNEALGAAAERGHARLVDRLIDLGADAERTDVVFCAVVGGQLGLVKDLVARGFATDFREPVLLEAVIGGDHGPMLDFLFDQGADRSRAHELYVRYSNRDSMPYAAIHATLKMWSERAMTVVYPIPGPQSLADLRAEEPDHRGFPQTLLVRMTKINRFGEALDLARAAGNDRLEVSDLLRTDAAGNSVIEILGARGGLSSLFAPDLWENRREDFAALYAEVAPVYRDQVDYQGLVSAWRRRALSNIKPLIPRLKKDKTMSVADIGDDDDGQMEYFRRCNTAELNGMYLSSARLGDWPRIEKLLEAGAELDYGGGAALTAAIDGGHIWLARKLVALGVNTVLSKQEALGDAVYANLSEAAEFLIDEVKADPAFNDSTVLFTAVVNDRAAMVRLLLEKGANVNANAGTLLDIALSRSFEDVATALIDGGADPRKSFLGKNAFEWAAEKHLRAVAARLRDVETDVFMSPGFFKRQTTGELRGRYDERQKKSGIFLAAEAGCFDIVRDKFLASPGDKLTRSDLTRGEQGRNALTALGEAGELALAFDPRLWTGRREEALLLANDVPQAFRDQVDADALAAEIDREALKIRARNASLKLKIPRP